MNDDIPVDREITKAESYSQKENWQNCHWPFLGKAGTNMYLQVKWAKLIFHLPAACFLKACFPDLCWKGLWCNTFVIRDAPKPLLRKNKCHIYAINFSLLKKKKKLDPTGLILKMGKWKINSSLEPMGIFPLIQQVSDQAWRHWA